MARSIRFELAGGFYHVMARGNRRGKIFADDEDRRFFLKTLADACGRTGWRVHGWVLMGNHYHLVLETPEPNLVVGMQWLQNAYTRRYNVRHRQWGRLFGDRYKAIIVEGNESYYYKTLLDYVHLNPVRARLIDPRRKQSVVDYPWSSVAGGYALGAHRRAGWLAAGHGLQVFECEDNAPGRRRFVERLDRRAVDEDARSCGVPVLPEEVDRRCSHLRRGWYWGRAAFAEMLLKGFREVVRKPKARPYASAGARRTHNLAQAEEWLRNGLAAAGLDEAGLEKTPGSEPRKLALATLLWERTTVSQSWIAERLKMSSAANVSQQIKRWREIRPRPKMPRELQQFLRAVNI